MPVMVELRKLKKSLSSSSDVDALAAIAVVESSVLAQLLRACSRRRRRRRRSGIAGAGLSLYARLISHFNITNMVFNYI